MAQEQDSSEAIGLLEELGLKEYEARCFLTLTRVSTGTAKKISDLSEVPRTRVYDAIRVLESKGLVEIHHSNPQQFRAVSIDEATETLRRQYDERIESLHSQLDAIDRQGSPEDRDRSQEVWSLNDHDAIQSRTIDMIANAESEIVLVAVEEEILTDALIEELELATDRGVSVFAGGLTDAVIDPVDDGVSGLDVFETNLDWLLGPESNAEVAISRLLLVDRTTLLVSSFYPGADPQVRGSDEQAIYATGLYNGLVVLIRRLVSSGLPSDADPTR